MARAIMIAMNELYSESALFSHEISSLRLISTRTPIIEKYNPPMLHSYQT